MSDSSTTPYQGEDSNRPKNCQMCQNVRKRFVCPICDNYIVRRQKGWFSLWWWAVCILATQTLCRPYQGLPRPAWRHKRWVYLSLLYCSHSAARNSKSQSNRLQPVSSKVVALDNTVSVPCTANRYNVMKRGAPNAKEAIKSMPSRDDSTSLSVKDRPPDAFKRRQDNKFNLVFHGIDECCKGIYFVEK